MDFGFDWGGSGGFQTRGGKKKKVAAAPAAKISASDSNEDKRDDAGANGSGGDDGLGGSGGDNGGGSGGGDDNNGGGNEDDDAAWGFSTGKKPKKKTKKQLDEEEEERKRKEEEEAQTAAAAADTNALSWADDANNENTNDDWTMSWGGAKSKDKTKKKKSDAPPAVPDAPSATSAFQDISLDDGAPKLDFTFDSLGDAKKPESGGGFGAWGKTWDFGSIGKEAKKEETSEFGGNNPWGFGSKAKKKTTSSGFDFGTDFGSTTNNDLNFDATDDVVESKPADDAWGFGAVGKKDKKKKAVEEIKEEPEPEQKEETWGTWGATTKKATTTTTATTKKKKNAFDDAFALAEEEPSTNGDSNFDWGFGSGSKDKNKDLISEVEEKPKDDGDDLMSGAWGAVGKKKTKKKTDDISTSFDLTSNNDTKASTDLTSNDPWSFGSKKDTKSKKNILDEFLVDEPEPIPEPPPAEEILVAWDFGLSVKDKKKKQKAMEKDGTWEVRVTQDMVDDQAARLANPPEPQHEPDAFATPELEPEPEPVRAPSPAPVEERLPWDHGLDAKARRKKQKDMQLAGTWADRLTQEKIDEEKAAAEAAKAWAPEPDPEPIEDLVPEPEIAPEEDATPPEDLVPWDHGLNAKDRKKKEKQMRLDDTWDSRLTQQIIDEKIAMAAEAAATKAVEEAILTPDPEPEALEEQADGEQQTRPEDLRPWDDGLSTKDKKKKEKQMKADGEWDNRLTQEKIDEMIAAAAAEAELSREPEPELEPEPLPDPGPIEEKKAWDHGLSAKEKKKKEKEMRLNQTWDSRLTQEAIDEEIAAAAAKQAEPEPEPEVEPVVEPEPEPDFVEERKPWDYGLNIKEKKKKEKEMRLNKTWDSRLTQEMIDADAEAAANAANTVVLEAEPESEILEPPPPPAVIEPRFPWDHGLSALEKKRREKKMKLAGTWDDRLTQEKIDEEAAAAAAAAAAMEPEPVQDPEPEAEPEPVVEESSSWGFGWGATKSKIKKKPVAEPEPTPVEEKTEEGWGGSWSLGFGKDKKKKKDSEVEIEPEILPDPEPEPEPVKEKDDSWGFSAPSTTASSKKKKDKGAKKSEVFEPVIEEAAPDPEPVPEPAPAAEDDLWAQFSKPIDKKTTKKSKKAEEALPAVPSPPDLGFEAEPEAAALPSVDDFNWGGLDSGRKSAKSPAVEAPAKKSASSLWGFGSTSTSTVKTKKEKDKEAKAKKEAEEQAQKEAEEKAQREAEEEERQQREKDEADRLAAEEAAEAAKAAKKSKLGKATKSPKVVEEKNKTSDLLDLLDEPVPTPASTSSKSKKSSARASANKLEDVVEEEKPGPGPEATDYFSFWGATSNTKKLGGKKTPDTKKETKTPVLTNEEDALLAELNEDEIQAILDDAPAPASPKLTRGTSNTKSARSSIANRIDTFESKKEVSRKTPKTSEIVLINEEPEPEPALTPKELKKAAKGKSSARSSKVQFEAPPSPEPEPLEIKKSKESVPGSFPGAFGDEDDDAMLTAEEIPVAEPLPELDSEPEPVAKSKTKKTTKVEKKVTKAAPKKKAATVVKEISSTFDDPVVAEPGSIDELDLLDEMPTKLPTPPPEDDSKSAKPAKKERARVERSATGSWALWGAQPTPKKPVRSKTMDDISPPTSKTKSPPAPVRSKTVKTSRKEEVDDSKTTEPSKTSGSSDKDSSGRPSDKPKPARSSTFTSFMMGAPPSAMRNSNLTRKNSTTTPRNDPATPSRRQSVDYSGLMSPPPEENSISKSAAKLMGLAVGKPSRRSSVKGKTNSYPDPYPIDDDDMVMINDRVKVPESISKPKNRIVTETKRSSTKPRSKTISGDEDVVMVDSPMAMESDFERPQLQRSNTGRSTKGFFGSLFSPGVRTPVERPRSAQVTDNEDATPRNRSRTTSQRRSRVLSPADGFTTDAQGETDPDAARRRARRTAKTTEDEEKMARDARRRERREREKADLEARQQRAREQARKEREAEEQRREERRARRKEKEAAELARIAQEEAEAEAAAREKEERRRLRKKLEAEATMATPVRGDERRRTYGGEDDLRRTRESRSKTKPSSGRKSTALMAEYHESRNGSGRGIKPPADKTSSWIDSQQDEPPELPPLEGTVLDESGQRARPVDEAEGRRRRTKDKYAGMTEDEIARHRAKRRERRIVEENTSGGSDEKQGTPARKSSKRQSKIYEDDYYAEPVRTFDARPQQVKRTSFLGKFF